MKAPLAGIRIIDLTMVWAGPYATRLLADMGAEVIKVEAAVRLDGTRRSPTPAGESDASKADGKAYNRAGFFNLLNRNKLGISLDLTTAGGKEVFKRLVAIGDVVVESFSPRVMKNFGLEYHVLAGVRPDLVMLSLPGYGSTGPYRDYVAYGTSIEASSGLSSLTGYEGGPPLGAGVAYGDPTAGAHGAFAVLAALRYRRRTGKGQHIDLSQREALTCLIGEAVVDYSLSSITPQRHGNADPTMSLQRCYPCKGEDKWVAITVRTDEEWDRLVEAMGKPAWSSQERFGSLERRVENRAELDRLVGEWTREREHYRVMHLLQAAGVPAGAVLSSAEVMADPQFAAREFFQPIAHPEAGTHLYPGLPWRSAGTPETRHKAAPCFAEHNEYVYKELMGLTDERLAELEDEGATKKEPGNL